MATFYPWQVAPLEKGFVATNSLTLLKIDTTVRRIDLGVRTVCSFNNMVLYGGFVKTPQEWIDYFNSLDVDTVNFDGFDEDTVLWTTPETIDVLFDFSYYIEDPADPFFFDYLQQGLIGFTQLTNLDGVYSMMPMRDFVVVYGRRELSVLSPFENPVFGFSDLRINHSTGIYNPGAVNGNLILHLYVGVDKNVWIFDGKNNERLGYKEFLESFDLFVVNYREDKSQFFVATNGGTLIINPKFGATWTDKVITGLDEIDGVYTGIYL